MLAVETLNAAIAAGTSSPDNFNQYALATPSRRYSATPASTDWLSYL
jgi:hypothetical protein